MKISILIVTMMIMKMKIIDNENDENYNNKFKNLKIKNLYKNAMEVKLKKIKTIHKTHNNKLLIDENSNEFVNELEYNSDSQSDLY